MDDPEWIYPRPPKLDPAEFMHYLDGEDLTEQQKIEWLETLWHIMGAFVDSAFDGSTFPPKKPKPE